MIYITGDMHGDKTRFDESNLHGESGWTADDVVIICGDFGFVFLNNEPEKNFLDELQKKPYTICFVDGNHENFPAVFSYPEEVWNGGRIHRIRSNVIHLMRGQVFEIQGKKIFTMGGAYSVDRAVRELGYSYWNEEMPCDGEYKEAVKNLMNAGMKVDYIITHTAPAKIIRTMGSYPDLHDGELTGFFDWVMDEVKFEKWFFGHWHRDLEVTQNFRAIYTEVCEIDNK